MTIKKFSTLSRFIAVICLTALTATIFINTRNGIVLAQENRTSPDTASVFDSQPITAEKQAEIDAPTVEQPDGALANCGVTAGTVYPRTILDQGVTTIGNNIYSFAGVSTTTIAASYKFDGTAWTSIADLPAVNEFPSVTSDGTNAYIIGGVNTTGSLATNYRYNVASNTYTTLAPAPTATWNAPAVFLNGKIYKIGGFNTVGTTTTAVTDVNVYDIATDTWTAGAAYPAALGFVSAITQGGFIYAAGGTGTAAGTISAKTFRFNPATNTWDDAAIADLPAARFGSAFANYNTFNGTGNFVMAGGFLVTTGTTTVITNTVIRWDLATNTWTASLPNLLQPRARMNGAVLNGVFYVIGGTAVSGSFTGTNDNQRLSCFNPAQAFIQGNVTYVSDNGTPVNNTPDPGETVTVNLNLQNISSSNSGANVTATLANSGGITPVTTTQNYGTLTAGAAATSRPFTFIVPAGAVCGSTITLTFNVTDGANSYTVTQTYTLGAANPGTSFSSTGAITINDGTAAAPAAASPYPATINVTGITGATQLVRVGINGMSHTFPADVDIMLVNPAGTAMMIMSDVGGGTDLVNTNFVIDDAAAVQFPITTIAAGGSFRPTNLDAANDIFPAPAPTTVANPGPGGTPAGTATLNGTFGSGPFNGTWQVFIVDDAATDAGSIQSVSLTFAASQFVCSTVGPTAPTNSRADFDGDGRTDLSVFRNGTWFAQRSTAGFAGVSWGAAGDVLLPGDYDGDNKTDFAIYRQAGAGSATDFYVLNSIGNTITGAAWGDTGDIPKNGDFTGDNRDDLAVYRPSTNTFFVLPLGAGAPAPYTRTFGAAGGQPYVLFYDADATADLATRNGATWTINRTTPNTTVGVVWGTASDRAVAADYDNDNRDDIAVFRSSTSQWFVLPSNGGAPITYTFGAAGDIPAPGDYDGDGDDEPAVFRNGTWFVNTTGSSFNSIQFGVTGDQPIPTAYVQQ